MIERIRLLLCLLFGTSLYFSCNPLAVQGPEPAFIDIPSVEFTYPFEQGPPEQAIQFVEIFFENFSIGYYEIPASISVVPTMDISNITIKPAISENGVKNAVTVYDMMTWHIVDQKFTPFETYEIIPQFKYDPLVVFDLVETFESSNGITFDLDEIDSTTLVRTTVDSRNGNYAGLITSENGKNIAVASDFLFTEIRNSREVFLEFDYRNNVNFIVGLAAFVGNENFKIPFYTVTKKDNWNKLYLDLSSITAEIPAEGYRIYFEMQSAPTSPPSEIFIDNLKLLHIN